MAEITAGLVKTLRDRSGVGMMDCKKALQETGGDIDAAIDWLRTKGMARAANKADRVAAEGVVAVAARQEGAGMTGALIELNAETDFVARNAAFQELARKTAAAGLDAGDVAALRAAALDGAGSVSEAVTHLVATIGENIVLRRSARLHVATGVIGHYVHPTGDVGRIGVLVALEGAGDQAKLRDVGRKVAMHIAHTDPKSLSTDDLDPAVVAYERGIFTEQAASSGKPPAVIERMVEGRLRKFYEEVVLLKQGFVMNPDQTIEQLVAETGASLTAFVRFALGDGIEKQTADFASEVAALTGA
ncbi:MAG TPA: translation elongation factor Ts [Caulobacteraceae bacterium]